MKTLPSAAWASVFPGPRIPDVLAYVAKTWTWLQNTFSSAVSFEHGETVLTDNLCEALADKDRQIGHRMDCDFQPETWELRRGIGGRVTRVARADIRVILGAPGTPHLVIEFKKLDGTSQDRRLYCFDGMSRFVEGKYAVGHAFGVMCGFSPNDVRTEAAALASYIAEADRPEKLQCVAVGGKLIIEPSMTDPTTAKFDTNHKRPGVGGGNPITLLHTLLPCASTPLPSSRRRRRRVHHPVSRSGARKNSPNSKAVTKPELGTSV